MQDVVVGQRMKSNVEFRLKGVRTDPILVRCLVRHPSGTLEVFNFPSDVVVKQDIGFYRAQFLVSESGIYHIRWEGSGTIDAVAETSFEVLASGVITSDEGE